MSESATVHVEPIVEVARRILAARAVEVEHYAKLYPLLLAEMSSIMADWDRDTDVLPWSALEECERQNDLPSVVTRVIDCAMSPAAREDRVGAMVAAACAHGESRRRQGVEVPSIFTEYNVVRSAMWGHLRSLAKAPTSYDAIFVIDGLLSIATRGTVLGYYRKEMQANGLWEKHGDELKKSVRS